MPDGDKEVLYFKDFSSGAMVERMVCRAKKVAIKRFILTGKGGLKARGPVQSHRGEYQENEDLPNTTNPDDWSEISGNKGERIVSIRTLMPETTKEKQRDVERVINTGQYL